MKQISILFGMLVLVSMVATATEIKILTPYDQQVFETNDHVMVGVRVTEHPVVCKVIQTSSNKDFEAPTFVRYFNPRYDAYFWIVNGFDSRDSYFTLDDGRYKIQFKCIDSEGDYIESEVVRFHVKG